MVDLKKTYDAIVVGSGAAGGIAAKELTEGGLEVLLLEAGPQLDPATDFLAHKWPYELPFRGFDRPGDRERIYPNQYTSGEYTRRLYIDDREHPYTTPPGETLSLGAVAVCGWKASPLGPECTPSERL